MAGRSRLLPTNGFCAVSFTSVGGVPATFGNQARTLASNCTFGTPEGSTTGPTACRVWLPAPVIGSKSTVGSNASKPGAGNRPARTDDVRSTTLGCNAIGVVTVVVMSTASPGL